MDDAVTEERFDLSTPYVLVARESNYRFLDYIEYNPDRRNEEGIRKY